MKNLTTRQAFKLHEQIHSRAGYLTQMVSFPEDIPSMRKSDRWQNKITVNDAVTLRDVLHDVADAINYRTGEVSRTGIRGAFRRLNISQRRYRTNDSYYTMIQAMGRTAWNLYLDVNFIARK